eukprot:695385-Rhodomonas_salina.3
MQFEQKDSPQRPCLDLRNPTSKLHHAIDGERLPAGRAREKQRQHRVENTVVVCELFVTLLVPVPVQQHACHHRCCSAGQLRLESHEHSCSAREQPHPHQCSPDIRAALAVEHARELERKHLEPISRPENAGCRYPH